MKNSRASTGESEVKPRIGDTGAGESQELVLAQMHPLNDVSAVVEHSPYVLRVDGACKVRVAEVLALARRCADTLKINLNT